MTEPLSHETPVKTPREDTVAARSPLSMLWSDHRVHDVALYLAALALNLYHLGSFHPYSEHFEGWAVRRCDLWSSSWWEIYWNVRTFLPNDTNMSVNAFPWEVLVCASRRFLGETTVFTERLPSALLCALAPVLLTRLVRLLYRTDIALAAGWVLATSYFQLYFTRHGYVGVTGTLCLGIIYSAAIILEGRRYGWITLTVLLVLMPYFYGPIRYISLMVAPPIFHKLVRSPSFRAKHWWWAGLSLTLVLVSLLPDILAKGGVLRAAVLFYDGRGEQLLLGVDRHRSFWEVWNPTQNAVNLFRMYVSGSGNRFFHPWCADPALWLPFQILLTVGFLRCLVQSRRSIAYLLPPLWTSWAVIPLFVTTGYTPNRLFLNLPADMLMITFGAVTPTDTVRAWLPRRYSWAAYAPFAAIVLWLSYQGLHCYFVSFPDQH